MDTPGPMMDIRLKPNSREARVSTQKTPWCVRQNATGQGPLLGLLDWTPGFFLHYTIFLSEHLFFFIIRALGEQRKPQFPSPAPRQLHQSLSHCELNLFRVFVHYLPGLWAFSACLGRLRSELSMVGATSLWRSSQDLCKRLHAGRANWRQTRLSGAEVERKLSAGRRKRHCHVPQFNLWEMRVSCDKKERL